MANRGQLTPTIQAAAKRLLSREITQQELRLMPYVQYVITNGEGLERRKINQPEAIIISEWHERGYLPDPWADRLTCGRYFWDVLAELLWLAYADHENQPDS